MTSNSDSRPEPGDPDFFARFTLSDDILDAAFGAAGGTPPPRVLRRGRADDTRAAAWDASTPATIN
jgi:hypothetical protein